MIREENLLESLKNCKAEGIQVYSTISETKATFAERTMRSAKNILYRYMEDNGYKYIHKLTQIVTTLNSRRNCSIDLIPKNVKDSDFLSILYSKPLREFIQEGHNHSENCITVKVSRRTQKVKIYLANEGSGLAFFSTDLGHNFGSNVGNEFGVMLRGKGPHKPQSA